MSVSMHDSIAITENLRMDYGSSLDSVSYLDHVNSLNEFGRLTYDLGAGGKVKVAYSSGAPPVELAMTPRDAEGDPATEALAQDLAALAVLPRLSLLDGHAAIQRSQDSEIGYEKKIRATTIQLDLYHERVDQRCHDRGGSRRSICAGRPAARHLVSEQRSRCRQLPAVRVCGLGVASAGRSDEIGTSFGSGGALAPDGQDLSATSAAGLRAGFRPCSVSGPPQGLPPRLPLTGTIISGSYQWMDYNDTIMPDHFYLTQSPYTEPGLNVRVRQPIPSVPGMPGRLEATAELQNGLAQGYLPVTEGGQHVTLVQSPRALRGGLSFIF